MNDIKHDYDNPPADGRYTQRPPWDDPLIRNAYIGLMASGGKCSETSLAVAASALRCAARPGSAADKISRATAIPARILSVDFEERSMRYVVTFSPFHREEGEERTETIRTERIDNRFGKRVQRLWDKERVVGHDAMIFKLNEAVGRDKKAPSGYRVAVWMQLL